MNASEALQNLVEYFEAKRNSALAASRLPSLQQSLILVEAHCYEDAMTMARQALNDVNE